MRDADINRLLKDVNLSGCDALPDAPSYVTQEMSLSDFMLGGDAQRYLRFVRACYDVNFFPSPEQALSLQSRMKVSQAERDLINDIVFDEIAERYGVPIEQRMRADYNAASVNPQSYRRYVQTRQRLQEKQARRRQRLMHPSILVRLWHRFVASNIIADEENI